LVLNARRLRHASAGIANVGSPLIENFFAEDPADVGAFDVVVLRQRFVLHARGRGRRGTSGGGAAASAAGKRRSGSVLAGPGDRRALLGGGLADARGGGGALTVVDWVAPGFEGGPWDDSAAAEAAGTALWCGPRGKRVVIRGQRFLARLYATPPSRAFCCCCWCWCCGCCCCCSLRRQRLLACLCAGTFPGRVC